jgi:hypothetical protein
MKKILQAAALILLTASIVYAAAHSHYESNETCNHEWEQTNKKKQAAGNHLSEITGVRKDDREVK